MTKKHLILFLAANPDGTDRLALDREARSIQLELKRSGNRDRFEFVTRWAVEPLDLLREVRELEPTVVHFSGHGGHSADRAASRGGRDVLAASASEHIGSRGLHFQDVTGGAKVVTPEAIAQTLGAAGASIKLVVLNACFTEQIATALLPHVDCVVGMSGSIHDDAARSFAIGFYGGLGEHQTIAVAFEQGRAAIELAGFPGGEMPRLVAREGAGSIDLFDAHTPSRLSSPYALSGLLVVGFLATCLTYLKDTTIGAVGALAGLTLTYLAFVYPKASHSHERCVPRTTPVFTRVHFLLLVVWSGGTMASVLIHFPRASLASAPLEQQPFILIVPDEQAVAMMTPHLPSPFVVTVNGTPVALPQEGILVGAVGDIPEVIYTEYRKHVASDNPKRVIEPFTAQLARSMSVTYDKISCGQVVTSTAKRQLWVFHFDSCKYPLSAR